LKVIIAKSKLYGIVVSWADVDMVASSLGCDHGSLPFVYLRLPVGRKMNKVVSWNEVKSILLDKELGGLGVGCLHSKNLGLLGKWKWHFLNEGNALWRTVITEFYCPDGGFGTYTSGAIGGVWADMLKAIKHIEDVDSSFNVSFSLKIGNGSNASFWKDHWCGDGSRLMDLFPRLYALESSKDYKINDRWHCLDGIWSGNWSWRCPPRGRALDELANLVSHIGNLSLDSTRHHYWNSWIPRKVNICVWRASLKGSLREPILLSEGLTSLLCHARFARPSWKILSVLSSDSPMWLRSGEKWGVPMFLMGYLEVEDKLVNSQSDDSMIIKDDDIFPSIQRLSKTWILAQIPLKTVN
ncbi:hypothetical protein Tco_1434161, partial [Tanacetum coccineum]